MKTKDDYRKRMDEQIEKRKKLLTELVNATQTEFDEDALLDIAWEAYDCLENVRKLREEMRVKFPKPSCTCNCHKEEEK